MSLRDVFNTMQSTKDVKTGGSVLRQASRRIGGTNGTSNGVASSSTVNAAGQRDSTISIGNAEPASASMSRLIVNMKPTPGGSHEPSPQPGHSNGGTDARYTVGVEADLFQKVQEEIKRLKIIVKGHEKRIKTLEDKLTEYQINYDDEDE